MSLQQEECSQVMQHNIILIPILAHETDIADHLVLGLANCLPIAIAAIFII